MTFERLDEFCGEKFWDENLSWNTTNPDLTVCLQQTLLIWIPCGILWLLLPVELYLQRTSVGKLLPWTGTNITRMMVALSLALLCFANLMDVTFNGRFENLFTANVVAETTKCATFILSVILMKINKKRGRHTSGVLFTFWFCLMICEICVYRSSFMQIKSVGQVPNRSSFIFKMIYFPLVIVSFFLSCFADIPYREVIFVDGFQQREKECPELSASFLSKLSFWWFNDMAVLGYRKPLVIEDLWDLNPEDKTEHVSLQFEKYWRGKQSEKLDHIEFRVDEVNGSKPIPSDDMMYFPITKSSRQKPVHIAQSLCKAFWPYFFIGTICKFVYDCLQFTNPIIFKMLIEYVQTSDPLWKGIVYSLLLFMNGCVQSVLLGVYFHRMFVLGMRIRTALVSAIYDKSLMLSAIARRSSTVGEIVNLMSVDSQRFMDLMTYLNLLWSAPFQIIIALVMLWNILGPSVLAGLFVMVILIPLNAFIASRAKTRQVKQMKRKDERVKLINEVLSGIKVLKLYAWEEAFKEQIIGIRNKEVDQLKGIAYLNTYGLILWNCSSLLVALASFACFVLSDGRNTLDATTAFVSLSLFNYLRFPLTMLPNMISTMVMTAVSVKRINKFLNSEELEEYVVRVYDKDSDDIIIRNGDFLWAKDEGESEKLTLSNINLNVKRGSLVAVVGQVGSGKSSLLSAILGDMEKMRGSVYISGSTAYVSQQAWIQNASLKNNILFLQPLHRQFYQDVLDACGLFPDLAVLPGGDSTEIGEKGINLSGGQKQRVSLARAVYSSADIYLLDDPLSAVDSHVGRHIFDRVIGPDGLLKGKTRILVTHGLTYLPQMDIILVIKNNTIAEMGSYQQLIDSRGPFSEFLSQYLLQNDIAEENREVLEDISSKNPELLRSLSSGSEACSDATETQHTSLLSISALPKQPSIHKEKSVSKEKIKQEDKQFNLIETEKAETGKVHWEVYINYMKAVGIKWVLIILIAHIIWQIFGVGSNVWLSEWGNDSLQPNASQNIHLRNIRLGVYGALGFAQGVAIFIGSFGIAYGTLQASNRLHQGLLLNVLKSPMSFFDTTPLGRIVNRFAKDVDTVDVTIPMTLRSWMSCLLQVIATVIVISVQTPIFLTVFVPVGILYYFIQRFYVSTSRQLKRLESITRSPIYSHFSETLAGCSTIRAYNAQESFRKQSSDLVDKNQVCYFPSIVSNRWLAIRLELCGNLIIFSAALFAVLGRDHLDPGRVGLSVSYALMITATLNWLVRMTSELETNVVAVERILEYTRTPTEASWVLSNVQIPDGWPQEGHVQLQNYSTRYREGLELVLKGITCDFAPREKVGIVGRTGAGKSSLTLSLFRIIEAAGGSILIDNVPIQNIGLHQLRTKITIIPQDPVLFSGTLRMNLDPFSWYSDDQIWEALAHAHLQNFVTKLNNGLLHEIAEGGENLSVGQRQLVCLARALLRKTKILVLDEATAAVDLETDDLIQATIRQKFADCAVLTIAHRLNTVMDYDRIMVLSHGNIQEFDSPELLLKNKKSEFYKMAKDAGLV